MAMPTTPSSPGSPRSSDHPDRFESLWAEEDAHITSTEQAIANGTITITEDHALDLAVVRIPSEWHRKIIHRFTMVAQEAAHSGPVHNATDHFVLITLGGGAPELRYRYETWVHYIEPASAPARGPRPVSPRSSRSRSRAPPAGRSTGWRA